MLFFFMQTKASLDDLLNLISPMIQNQLPEVVTIKIIDRENFMIQSKISNEYINKEIVGICNKHNNVSTNLKYASVWSLTKAPNN